MLVLPTKYKLEYYDGNRSVSIDGIALENFIALPQIEINSYTKPFPQQVLFHSFLSDDIKQDSDTTTAHSKRLIELLKKN